MLHRNPGWLYLSVALRAALSSSAHHGAGVVGRRASTAAVPPIGRATGTGRTVDFRRLGRGFPLRQMGDSVGSEIDDQAVSTATELRGGGASKGIPAILFDIDGVFKHGGAWDPQGFSALCRVMSAGIPFAFMTNGGGGRTEVQYATEMSEKLAKVAAGFGDRAAAGPELSIPAQQMVLSYSPWAVDLEHLKGHPILIVGDPADKVMAAARAMGLGAGCVHISDLDARHPLMNPFGKHENTQFDSDALEAEKWGAEAGEDFQAVCVFTDPSVDFFGALQLCTDVLLSSRPGQVEAEDGRDIPVYFSNPDLLWKTQYPWARFGQGAFRLSLEAVFSARLKSMGASDHAVAGRLSTWVQYGKPEVAQYHFAVRSLEEQLKPGERIAHVYMVGDNPQSDMQGPKNMNALQASLQGKPAAPRGGSTEAEGPEWAGVLVRTGVYADGDDANGAMAVVDGVAEAVDFILQKHGL